MNTAAVAKWLADAFEQEGWRSWRKKPDHSVEQQTKEDFFRLVKQTLDDNIEKG